MKKKQQLKQLKQFIHDQTVQAKLALDNGCFPHNSIKEEAIARTKYETLKLVALQLINLENEL